MSSGGQDDDAVAYDAFAREMVGSGVLTDPWYAGRPRFRRDPIVLPDGQLRAMYRAAEDVASVYNEMCLVVEAHPELLESFFGLTPFQRAMWLASAPMWHGIARADVFLTDEGLAFAELNCDTPTGEAEAVVLGSLAAREHASEGLTDPNRGLEGQLVAMVEALASRELGRRDARSLGIVYPTEMTDDLALVRLYRAWFEARGYEVVLGSPYNLTGGDEGVRLFDRPIEILLRHYKTDWWGERAPAWDDAVIPDTEPLYEPLTGALEASTSGTCAVVNPFGAVLPQNKRAMAFMWEHIHRFSPRATSIIERHVPVTSRLETMHGEQLLAQRDEWVLKSDYGAEGDEVVVGRRVTDEVWRASLAHASPGRWVAQRYFDARTNERGETVNYGVYLVAGVASGLYVRVQEGPTDERALSVPVLVRPGEGPGRTTG